jgi:hypothetical protein
MVIFIQDVLAQRRATAVLATNRMVASGGKRNRSYPAPAQSRRTASTTSLLPGSDNGYLPSALDLPALYAEATLV